VPAISTRTQITPSASLTAAVVEGSLSSRGTGGEQGIKKSERMLPCRLTVISKLGSTLWDKEPCHVRVPKHILRKITI
jgi:hypothetical protein